jgi:hypothetical protein
MSRVSTTKNDLYGGMNYLAKNVLKKFCNSLVQRSNRFQLFHVNALKLVGMFKDDGVGIGEHTFDRIEVS